MAGFLERINAFVWGVPALIMIVSVGLYLSLRTGFAQIRLFPKSIRTFLIQFKRHSASAGTSSYRALCTALAATVGTGNLAGVAGAICIGGPGSVFWMWICALLGMVTKFAEATLAVRYRKRNSLGEWVGGPMYMIENGLGKKWKWLAAVYCCLCLVASLGVGNATQINTIIGSVNSVIITFGGHERYSVNLIMGIFLAILIGVLLLGGAKRIGQIVEKMVPFASVTYLLIGLAVLVIRRDVLPDVFASIITGAFDPAAVTGGMLGSAFIALRVGASRGVFTNEAGMGTASIAHGAADVNDPVDQGLMGILEVFLDTVVICTMTALVILSSGVSVPYGKDVGISLTSQAFGHVCGDWAHILIALMVSCFAIATVLGWSLYGARCAQYLFGEQYWKSYVIFQVATVILGAVLRTGAVWVLAEIVNGLMAIPNLIAIAILSPELVRLLHSYKRDPTVVGSR